MPVCALPPAVHSKRVLSGVLCQLSCLPRTSPGRREATSAGRGDGSTTQSPPQVAAHFTEEKNGGMGPNCHCPVFVIYILYYIYLKLLLSKPNGKNYLAVRFDSPPPRVLLILGAENQNFTHWPCNLL